MFLEIDMKTLNENNCWASASALNNKLIYLIKFEFNKKTSKCASYYIHQKESGSRIFQDMWLTEQKRFLFQRLDTIVEPN